MIGYGFFVIGCGYFLSIAPTSFEGYLLFTPKSFVSELVLCYNVKIHHHQKL